MPGPLAARERLASVRLTKTCCASDAISLRHLTDRRKGIELGCRLLMAYFSTPYGLVEQPYCARWQVSWNSMERMEGGGVVGERDLFFALLRAMVRYGKTQTCRGAGHLLVVEPGRLVAPVKLRPVP